MAVIDPPGQPLSVPHQSRRYCDMARVGSSAEAETAKQTPASPAMAHFSSQRLPQPYSRKVFKLLNHNLAWLLQRIFVARNDEKDQTEFRLTRSRYGKRELMFRNELRSGTRRSSAKGLESCMSRFPAQDIRQSARGRRKREQGPRTVERLNCILCIVLICSVTSAMDLYVHLAKAVLASRFVEGKHTEGGCGF